MKILIVTPIFPPDIGGPATYASELAKQLSDKHQVTIISFTPNPIQIKNVKTISISLHEHALGFIFRQTKLVLAVLREISKSDIVYIQGPMVVGFVSTIIAKILSKPSILKFVGDVVWEEALRKQKTSKQLENFLAEKPKTISLKTQQGIQKLSLKNTDKIITPSNYLKHVLVKYYQVDSSKVLVLSNATEIIQGQKKPVLKTKTIITSGRLVPHKQFELVIEAFDDLLKRLPRQQRQEYKLVIAGRGGLQKRLEEIIEKKGLKSQVNLTGALTKEKYFKLLNSASIFVLASSYEGLPHAIIEAMVLGTPVIATDIPGNREVIKHEKSGLLVKANSIDISKAMLKLLEDDKLKSRFKENAIKQAKKQFNWDTHTQRLIHIFRKELTS